MTQFGKLLRRERKERKMLLGDLADQLKISVPYLSQIETGARPVKEGIVKKVIEVLGLGASEANAFFRAAAQSTTEFNIQLKNNAPTQDRILASRLATGFARMSPEKKRLLRELMEDPE